MLYRKRPPPLLACNACGAFSRVTHALDGQCPEVGCSGLMRPLESIGFEAHHCRDCRGTGRAEDGGEAYRCSACGGDGWRILKRAHAECATNHAGL